MDKVYKKERFESLSIKSSVVKKFRKYSKSISKSNSMTLLLMMEFFERNELSPEDDLKPGLIEIENRIKKRINGLIAIIKNIEKNQTKPTMAMLQALFENVESKEKLLVEKSFEQLENERFNKEFRARLKEKSESDYKNDSDHLNNGE